MTIRAVLFDYGQTLVDFRRTEDELRAAYHDIRTMVVDELTAATVPALDELIEQVAHAVDTVVQASYAEARLQELDIAELFDDALRGIGLQLPAPVVQRIVERDHGAYTNSLELPGETVDVLTELRRRGLRTGFVSNAHFLPELLRADMDAIGLAPLLDAGIFSVEIGVRKPQPAIFHHVLGQLATEPDAAIMVGDRVGDDVGGAQAAGLRAGVLTHQYRQEEPAGTEHAVIDRLTEILDVIDAMS